MVEIRGSWFDAKAESVETCCHFCGVFKLERKKKGREEERKKENNMHIDLH